MEINFDQCWGCPLGIRPALAVALAAVFFLFIAVRLYRARRAPIRFVGSGAAAIAVLLYTGLARHVGFHGLAMVSGPDPLPSHFRFLFFATWLAVSAAAFHLGRSRASSAAPAAS